MALGIGATETWRINRREREGAKGILMISEIE
jgi:hypothetical protein